MQLSVIQLNARHFKYFYEIFDYIKASNADIIFLQEVATWSLSSTDIVNNPCEYIAQKLWYNMTYGKRYWSYNDKNNIDEMWVAILSKYKLKSHKIHYINETWLYRILTQKESQLALGISNNENEKKLSYTIDQSLPSCILECNFDIWGKSICCLTTKFPASSKGGVNQAMINHLNKLIEILISYNKVSIIIWLDANITAESEVIRKIEELLKVSNKLWNTLNSRIHPWFSKWIPKSGLEVDYIFTTSDLKVLSYKTDEADISDHLPVKAIIEYI